jgi:hypothetical protein
MPGARADFTFFHVSLAARDRYCACVLSGRCDTTALHCTAAVSQWPLAGLGGLWSPDSDVSSSELHCIAEVAMLEIYKLGCQSAEDKEERGPGTSWWCWRACWTPTPRWP